VIQPVDASITAKTGARVPAIELQNVSKRFPGILALDNVSLAVYPGEIHSVIGENGAGKSTLINVLMGELQPDAGRILYMGQPRTISSPYEAQTLGISVVHQELALCPNLSVAENISMSSVAGNYMFQPLQNRQFQKDARQALQRLGMEHVALDAPVRELSVALQQLVEIAKAISTKARVLILDEPNSALTEGETAHLFETLRQLRAEGVAILYVSHKLDEVLALSDRITVMRDGQYVATFNAQDATVDAFIEKMVGRAVTGIYERPTTDDRLQATKAPNVLDVANLSSGPIKGVTFSVRAGEILGIAGLPDSGKDELVGALFGLRPLTSGEMRIKGKPVTIKSPSSAIRQGLALVPADRREEGALLTMDIQRNIAASSLDSVSTARVLRFGAIKALAQDYVKKLDVRARSVAQRIATLSGGNQQKVILARALATQPSVLLLHEPTRGIDVGAKAEIYAILQALAQEGVGAVIVSSELPELIGQCDRILAMYDGRIAGEFSREEAAEEPILAAMTGHASGRSGES
jgi:ABC-type sugar transport system ATPase subunit